MDINGKNTYVFVYATPSGMVLYFARTKKGMKAEYYQGILVHNHDATFYKYGNAHQECLAHILHYLKDSIDNESDRTWNKKMRSLVQEMVHYRNSLVPLEEPDSEKVSEFEERYREILKKALEEYEYIHQVSINGMVTPICADGEIYAGAPPVPT